MTILVIITIANIAIVLIAIFLIVNNGRSLGRIEKSLRARNEAIANALVNRSHTRAFSDDKPGSKLSVRRINW
jgi:hypothetical protein